jgi:hypothetical protein
MCVKACAQQPTAFENVHEAFLVFSGAFLKSSQLKKVTFIICLAFIGVPKR